MRTQFHIKYMGKKGIYKDHKPHAAETTHHKFSVSVCDENSTWSLSTHLFYHTFSNITSTRRSLKHHISVCECVFVLQQNGNNQIMQWTVIGYGYYFDSMSVANGTKMKRTHWMKMCNNQIFKCYLQKLLMPSKLNNNNKTVHLFPLNPELCNGFCCCCV